jgi:sugar/nucleoside kinase (ribokinase family)
MTRSQHDVCGIGNAIVDVLARVDDSFITQHGLAKGGMKLIEQAEAETIYAAMGPAIEISGGSAANSIAGLAALGGSAAFIGRIKADALGDIFAHDIRAAGVTFTTLPAKNGPSTARCYVLVTPDGERTMNTFLGASVEFSATDIDREMIEGSAIVYLEGYLWDRPAAKEAFVMAARTARAAGRLVALTLSDRFCVDRHRESFLDLIRSEVDILFANESEITGLYQTNEFETALKLAKRDCKLAALTRSALGSVVIAGDAIHSVPAQPVDEVVDTTGSGDLYAAGFLFGLSRGRTLPDCARLGSLAAAEVISHLGARPQADLKGLARAAGLL